MKKFIQKTVAGVSALAMTAALSATAVPAFADEYEAVQEADFVQSYAVGEGVACVPSIAVAGSPGITANAANTRKDTTSIVITKPASFFAKYFMNFYSVCSSTIYSFAKSCTYSG